MSVIDHRSLKMIFNHRSEMKMLASYWYIYKNVAVYSFPAILLSYVLFLASCRAWPLGGMHGWHGGARAWAAMLHAMAWSEDRAVALLTPGKRLYPVATAWVMMLFCWPHCHSPVSSTIAYSEFKAADRDGNGFVDLKEFRDWARQSHNENEDRAAVEFDSIDVDHHAKIDFPQWRRYLRRTRTA